MNTYLYSFEHKTIIATKVIIHYSLPKENVILRRYKV